MSSQSNENIERVVSMIEDLITDLGLSPEDSRLKSPDIAAWGLSRGSADVYVTIRRAGDSDADVYLRCMSPLMDCPPDPVSHNRLTEHLLRLNASLDLTHVYFGLRDNTVVLLTERTLMDLDPSEAREMLLAIGYYADEYDDLLVGEFGGKLVE